MKTRPVPAAIDSAIAAFEQSIRQLGEGPARLENVAELMVGLLESRRDLKLARRGESERA